MNDDFDSAGTQLLLNSDDHSAGEEDSSTANIIRLHYLNNGTFSRARNPTNASKELSFIGAFFCKF